MEKRSNALSIVLGLICVGLIAYIAFDKPVTTDSKTAGKDSAGRKVQRMMSDDQSAAGNATAGGSVAKTFCAMPPSMLVDLIRNYKNEVWSKTSNPGAGQMDARFMEIPVDQLQNFIDVAKASANADGVHLASVRIYYINYGGTKKTETELMANHDGNVFHDYAGCHSLAFVPVVGDTPEDPNRRDYFMKGQDFGQSPTYNMLRNFDEQNFVNDGSRGLTMIPNYTCNEASLMENHNQLCPPLSLCCNNTLLNAADHD